MTKFLEKFKLDPIDEKINFAATIWLGIILLYRFLYVIFDIPENNKTNLIEVLLNYFFLLIAYLNTFKISQSLNLKFRFFSSILIKLNIFIHFLSLIFIIFKIILLNSNTYFKSIISYNFFIICFINLILTFLLILILSIKIKKVKVTNTATSLINMIIFVPLTFYFVLIFFYGSFSFLFSKPDEIEVIYKKEHYIVRMENFLRPIEETRFIYYKPINSLLVEELNIEEVPSAILGENNNYYGPSNY